MDDIYETVNIDEYFNNKRRPIKIGDRFYVNNYEVKIGRHPPIYNVVEKIIDSQEPGVFYVEAFRPQCSVGTNAVYSSVYFKNPDVVIERKGIDF